MKFELIRPSHVTAAYAAAAAAATITPCAERWPLRPVTNGTGIMKSSSNED